VGPLLCFQKAKGPGMERLRVIRLTAERALFQFVDNLLSDLDLAAPCDSWWCFGGHPPGGSGGRGALRALCSGTSAPAAVLKRKHTGTRAQNSSRQQNGKDQGFGLSENHGVHDSFS